MEAIIAEISEKLSNTTISENKEDVNTIMKNNDKHGFEHKEMKYPCESDGETRQRIIIKELQLMNNCTSCYLEERTKTLLTPEYISE